LKCPSISIHADYARLLRQLESPGSARSTRPTPEIEYCYVRWNTSFKPPNDLAYEKEMERCKVHGKRRSLSRTAKRRSRIDAVPPLDINIRKRLDRPPDL